MRLQCEARAGVEGGDLVESQRRALGVVEGFDEGPLDAGHVDGEAMAAASVLADWRRASRRVSSRDCAAKTSGWDAR